MGDMVMTVWDQNNGVTPRLGFYGASVGVP